MVNKAITTAGCRLMKKIQELDIMAMPISDYNKRYFSGYGIHSLQGGRDPVKTRIKTWVKRNILGRKNMYPKQYIEIMDILLHGKTLDDLPQMTFLDHGGGTGLLSLLAAELGFGKVYYNDIYEVSCHDSARISEALGHESIIRIQGDFEDIEAYCQKHTIFFDCIGSYDVIEHIYDIKGFLEKITSICSLKSTIFLYSSANSYNPFIVKKLSEGHERFERKNREYVFGWKERDSLRSYASIREEIIKNEYTAQCLPEPDRVILDKLVASTRGLMLVDIQNSVRGYIAEGTFPKPDIYFPSNTCDPMTGNWAEHLMDFSELLTVLQKSFNICSLYPEKKYLPKASCIGLYARRD